MGFRYRKSINLGGGFRINFSKSGIGYSWGTKGYRATRTARGTNRITMSIPGTGISYVRESGKKKSNSPNNGNKPVPQPAFPIDNNLYDTEQITNKVATEIVSGGLETILVLANRTMKLKKYSIIGLCVAIAVGLLWRYSFLFAAVFALLLIYANTKGQVNLHYDIDEDQKDIVDKRMIPMIKIAECAKVWRIMQTSRVIDRKYSGGASSSVNRVACTTETEPPFPFKTNIKIAAFKTGNETMLFFPDKLIIVQGINYGALSYDDISSYSSTTRFMEDDSVPSDAREVGYTWKYINKSGGPDRRFKDNRRIPICLYGELELTSKSGLNTVLMYSNPDAIG